MTINNGGHNITARCRIDKVRDHIIQRRHMGTGQVQLYQIGPLAHRNITHQLIQPDGLGPANGGHSQNCFGGH